MSIEFNCPHCVAFNRVEDSAGGEHRDCVECGARLKVPDRSGDEAELVAGVPLPKLEPKVIPGETIGRRKFNKALLIGVLLYVGAMFLPWIHLSSTAPAVFSEALGSYVSGFEVPFAMDRLANLLFRRTVTPEQEAAVAVLHASSMAWFSLYLLPLVGLLALVHEAFMAEKGVFNRWVMCLTAAMPLIVYAIIHFTEEWAASQLPESVTARGTAEPILMLNLIPIVVVLLGMLVCTFAIFLSPGPVERPLKSDVWHRHARRPPI